MSRTLRRGALVAAIAAGVVLATPALASAHVGVSPDEIPLGSSTLLTFSFSHGCAGSPTTALRVSLPEGTAAVSPTFDAAWDAQVEKNPDGSFSAVTFTAVRPVPNELRGAVSLSYRPAEDAAGQLAFPVEQTCEKGSSEWVDVAAAGEDPEKLEHPSPLVSVTAATDGGGDHAHSGEAHSDHTPAVAAGEAAGDADGTSTTPATLLSAGGLVAGIAALVVAIAAYRRRA